ncbi:MAG: MFS transporter [Myxococcota bacterium]|nr:MFS transporter [Myxococcota bacterium]
MAIVLGFEQYDMGILNAVLPQIIEAFSIRGEDSGTLLGTIRLGGFGAVLLVPLADRLGRRRIFLVTMVGMGLGEFLTAFSTSAFMFGALQVVARCFLLAALALGIVILVEELPAAQRGAGIAFLGVLSGTGYGLAAMLYAAVDVVPGGWRTLYVIGSGPLFLVPFFRRALPETHRFTDSEAAHAAQGSSLAGLWLAPVRELLTRDPRRVVFIGFAGALAACGTIAFFQYASFHLATIHGWSPAGYAVLVGAGGLIGLAGGVFGGRLSDRLGRRTVGSVVYLLAPLGMALFYLGPTSLLILTWGVALVFVIAGDVVLRAYFGELFPTSHRSTSLAWMLIVQTVGWAGGLYVVDFLSGTVEDLPAAVATVGGACALAGLCLLALPETARTELDAEPSA